jgi:hypothetical protein
MLFQHMEPSNGSPAPMLGRVSSRTLAAMAVAFLPLFAPTPAKADLSLLSGDTVFGTNVHINTQTSLTGNVAVGGTLTLDSGPATIHGGLILNTTPTAALIINPGNTQLTVTSGQSHANLSGAVSAIQTQSTLYQGMTPNQTISAGTINSSSSPFTISAGSGTTVVDINGSLNPNAAITLSGTANDILIVNITGSLTLSGSHGISLSGGLTASDVLFNVEGGNVMLNGTVNGTFLVANGTTAFSGTSTLNGSILDAGIVTAIDVNADNITINGAPFSGLVAAPEPAPLVKAISGLATIGIWGFFRRKRSKSK